VEVEECLQLFGPNGQTRAAQSPRQLLDRGRGEANQFHQDRQSRGQRQESGKGGSDGRDARLLAQQPLLLRPLRLHGQIKRQAAKSSSCQPPLANEQRQEVADRGEQQAGKFIRGLPGRRSIDQGHQCLCKSVVPRETDGAIEPQAVAIETRRVAQGIVAGVVVETAEVAVLAQSAENGHARETQRGTESIHAEDGPMLEGVDDQCFLSGQQ